MNNQVKINQAATKIICACKVISNHPMKHASYWFSGDEINVFVIEGFRTTLPIRTIDLARQPEKVQGLLTDLAEFAKNDVPNNLHLGLKTEAQGSAFLGEVA